MDDNQYKTLIKNKVREEALKEFKVMQASHEKGKYLHYEHLTGAQNYLMTNQLNNKEVSLLVNLRCQSVSGVKDNFHQQFRNNLMCELCAKYEDSQEHLVQCHELRKHIKWDHENV